jgi:hypothetical protein
MTAASRFPNPQPYVESIEHPRRDELVIKQRRVLLLWNAGVITAGEFNRLMKETQR